MGEIPRCLLAEVVGAGQPSTGFRVGDHWIRGPVVLDNLDERAPRDLESGGDGSVLAIYRPWRHHPRDGGTVPTPEDIDRSPWCSPQPDR
jgi:hypothetical protein